MSSLKSFLAQISAAFYVDNELETQKKQMKGGEGECVGQGSITEVDTLNHWVLGVGDGVGWALCKKEGK